MLCCITQTDFSTPASAVNAIPRNRSRRDLYSDRSVLVGRSMDKAVRSLLSGEDMASMPVMLTGRLLAATDGRAYDVAAINAASTALLLSDIPFKGPVAAVRVGMAADNGSPSGGQFVANPVEMPPNAPLDMLYVGCSRGCVALEGGADRLSSDDFESALRFADAAIQPILKAQLELARKAGLDKSPLSSGVPGEEVVAAARALIGEAVEDIFRDTAHSKSSRLEALREQTDFALATLAITYPHTPDATLRAGVRAVSRSCARTLILNEGLRADGRGLHDLRPLGASVDILPGIHGSALFTRGETEVLATATLDSPAWARPQNEVDGAIGGAAADTFFLDYSFPAYSMNAIQQPRERIAAGRREVGHAALAARALRYVYPSDHEFATRVAAEVTSSHGSSSMATVCAGSLAMLDAGVPLIEPVAGVACGLVTPETSADDVVVDSNNSTGSADAASQPSSPSSLSSPTITPTTTTTTADADGDTATSTAAAAAAAAAHCVLVDLTGMEDSHGDMDLKLAGTRNALTAWQLDVKKPVPVDILLQAAEAAAEARGEILDAMDQSIAMPRNPRKSSCPVATTIALDAAHRGAVVGQGGQTIRGISAQTGASIDINSESGTAQVHAPTQSALDETVGLIREIVAKAEAARAMRRDRQGGGGRRGGGGGGGGGYRGVGDKGRNRDDYRRNNSNNKSKNSKDNHHRNQRNSTPSRPSHDNGNTDNSSNNNGTGMSGGQ